VHDVTRNLVFAWRQIRRRPGFSLVVVLTLGLGIGGASAVFSVVNGAVLRPLSFDDPGSLVSVWPGLVTNVRAAEWLEQNSPSIAGIAGASTAEFTLTGEGVGQRLRVVRVTPNYFDVLRATPLMGRTFLPEDAEPGRSRVVVLGHGLWRERYGADPQIVGRTIRLEHEPFTVVGVMPEVFRPLDARDRMWVPQEVRPGTTVADDETWWILERIGRLAPGATVAAAERDLKAGVGRLAELSPTNFEATQAAGATVVPLAAEMVGSFGRTAWILFGAAGLVLLVACANVANLLLARAPLKQRDVAVRTALGASRGAVLRHLLTESLVLGSLGGAVGIVLARLMVDAWRILSPVSFPRIEEVGVDGAVLLFAVAASLVTALLFGLAPAFRATDFDVSQALGGGRRTAGRTAGQRRLASILVGSEVAVSVVLVVGAGLLIRTLGNLMAVDPGFRAEGVLTMQVSPPPGPDADGRPDMDLYRRVWERLAALPGVEAVGAIHILPLDGGNNRYPYWAEDNLPPAGGRAPAANIRVATPGYLSTLEIPLLEGRWFTADDRRDARPVMVLNEGLARRLWPDESAVGKEIRLLSEDSFAWEVIGVIADVRQMALGRDPSGELYLPHEQWGWPSMVATIRTTGRPEALAPVVTAAIHELDPDIAVTGVSTLEHVLGASLSTNRFLAVLMTVFGAFALALGAVGVYGVVAQGVGRRVPEFAVRVALGSSSGAILRSTTAEGLGPVSLGLVAGVAGAWGLSRVLTSLLFEVGPADPLTYLTAAGVFGAVAAAAWWIPARRATRIDPMAILREE